MHQKWHRVFGVRCAPSLVPLRRSSFVGSKLSVGECLLVTQGECLQLTAWQMVDWKVSVVYQIQETIPLKWPFKKRAHKPHTHARTHACINGTLIFLLPVLLHSVIPFQSILFHSVRFHLPTFFVCACARIFFCFDMHVKDFEMIRMTISSCRPNSIPFSPVQFDAI